MPLYATLHVDSVLGAEIDKPFWTRIMDASDAEDALDVSLGIDLGEDPLGTADPLEFADETAVINLDLIFTAMREAGYTVTVIPPTA